MKKKVIIANLVLILATLIFDVFYIVYGTILIKTITSTCFVLLGGINVFYAIKERSTSVKFIVILFLALVFSFGGDVALYYNFITGALLFATAHILYLLSYCVRERLKVADMKPSIIIAIPSVLMLLCLPVFEFGSSLMKFICVMYAIIISFMTGKSIGNCLRNQNVVNALMVLGSVLFFFSDLMLVFDVFAGAPRITDILCLVTYYPSQCVFGYGMYKAVKEGL